MREKLGGHTQHQTAEKRERENLENMQSEKAQAAAACLPGCLCAKKKHADRRRKANSNQTVLLRRATPARLRIDRLFWFRLVVVVVVVVVGHLQHHSIHLYLSRPAFPFRLLSFLSSLSPSLVQTQHGSQPGKARQAPGRQPNRYVPTTDRTYMQSALRARS